MKRLLIALLALSVLALPACTRTVIERVPYGSPAAVEVGTTNRSADSVVEVVKKVEPAVVNVTTNLYQQSELGIQPGRGVGSGFVIRRNGIVVTNYHVVEGASRITVITPPPDSRRYSARVIGGDPTADLAVLRIDASGLPTVPLGDSAKLQLGQRVVALGYALALRGGPTVTSGIVSGLGRSITAQDPNCRIGCQTGAGGVSERTYTGVIQTDAAINPGNSGGPLVNLAGQVIGINTAGDTGAENVGFAIAIDTAELTIAGAIAHPSAPVAYLGVVGEGVSASLALQFNLPVQSGVLVVSVVSGGPADSSGIREGDVIVRFDGQKVTGWDQLGGLIRRHSPGDKVQVDVVNQQGVGTTVTVTLGTNPVGQG
jgi:serine protease Do